MLLSVFCAVIQIPNYWVQVRLPGFLGVNCAMFFAFAGLVSLLAMWLLSYEADVRKIGFLGALITTYLVVYLGLLLVNAVIKSTPTRVAIHEMAVFGMFYAMLGACSRGSPIWLYLQWALHIIMCIVLGAEKDPRFLANADVLAATQDLGGWRSGMFYFYFLSGAVLRLMALRACMLARTKERKEGAWYVFLIICHLAGYLTFMARPRILASSGVDTAYLLHIMVIIIVYCFTPIVLAHFISLSASRTLDLRIKLEAASRAVLAAETAGT